LKSRCAKTVHYHCVYYSIPSIISRNVSSPSSSRHNPAEGHSHMQTAAIYIAAAFAEIAGCFAVWAWLRKDAAAWWLAPGALALGVFAYLLTRVDSAAAGRAYAAYGGVYIAATLVWLWAVEGTRPDRWDITGALICLIGASIILFAPHRATG